ncbi:MAG: aldehyde dehydrogenase family protein [Ignavibacteriaceae bacterium]|jgi:NAD-dependent aldehyde dehydrogenases|nr:MAG: aldehyde dehydrogenase [Chlorobiota bacterium]KXK01612.1 MAG: aldehyde dehydrogenase [Chlorobi bacterium OLB4]MBV6398636.1 Succinate-semialdehyde dehydrogenase [NADP(+)] [Ignavibacteria bacterium]MCC6885196.1 aldehyde dehydrogenase [Ignavibacteriales bacterium]MCE7952014.1 aldehyde dehydrogenase [Chlorobi bacterium CHB7]MDL1886428.1 aldehyde dehydrogenase [Ignavibacteria bacterium CHB1]MEB2330418.1 aldehyde dehydrogenase family protein [Ignavibacteriaceae bacterium]OQY77697.1 MAG: hy
MRQKFILDINPSTGELIEKIKCSSSGEIASAIKLARKALKTWSDTPIKSKIAAMKRIAKDLMKEKEELGKLITDEMGKIYKSAVGEVVGTANAILENIKLAEKAFQMEKYQEGNLVTELYRVPIGVVAVITPWNFPVGMPESLLTPAILAGNSVVFKPSELTPLTGKMLYTIYNRHLPKGVINLLLGAGEVGEELVNSEIDMVGFVGSQAVGKKIMEASSKRLNRLVLELGGKDPMIILKDADLTAAAKYAVVGSLRNSGQVCVSVERIFVEEKIADKFEKLVIENVKKFKVGDGYGDNDMGPMVSEEQRSHVVRQIEEAQRKGAQIIYSGNRLNGKGFWLEPTVITNLADKHNIMNVETFGPVICIQKVKTPEEAIEKANNLNFGLGATIWSKNKNKVKKYAMKIESGMIGVNQGIGGVSGTPWVGIKQSGFGYLGSIEGMRQFTVPKKISFRK